jgi:hypothetical protein
LVALRTLSADGSHQPSGSPILPASLPLVLRAYPFVAGANKQTNQSQSYLIDETIPDKPSDVGAPILTPSGTPGLGTLLKLKAVAAFNEALPLTQAMTDHLVKESLFEPWPLKFNIAGHTLEVNDLFVVRQSEFNSANILRFIKIFGPGAAGFLGAHRISLFRAGALVLAVRGLTPPASEKVEPQRQPTDAKN